MRRLTIIIIFCYLGIVSLMAQGTFFPTQKGMELRYKYYDAKGNIIVYINNLVKDIAYKNAGDTIVSITSEVLNPEYKKIQTDQITVGAEEKEFFDNKSMAYFIHLNKKYFNPLISFAFDAGGQQALEECTVEAGTFLCRKRESKTTGVAGLSNSGDFYHYIFWFAGNIGIVKIEKLDYYGKTEKTYELTEIINQ